jgi:hypothetical protein
MTSNAVLTFRTDVPVSDTLCFEEMYEPALRVDADEKRAILNKGLASWIFVDGAIAGECYGISPPMLDEELPDCEAYGLSAIYCYGTTILSAYQGRGLSKILCAYWSGLVTKSGYRVIIGHATSPAMVSVRKSFGARFKTRHEQWFGTTRTAHFYEIEL